MSTRGGGAEITAKAPKNTSQRYKPRLKFWWSWLNECTGKFSQHVWATFSSKCECSISSHPPDECPPPTQPAGPQHADKDETKLGKGESSLIHPETLLWWGISKYRRGRGAFPPRDWALYEAKQGWTRQWCRTVSAISQKCQLWQS